MVVNHIGVSIEGGGGKNCLALVMHGLFCNNNFLNPFCSSFESNLNLVLLVKVFLTKKACNVVLKSFEHEEIILRHEAVVS